MSSCANISIPRCVKPPGFVAETCDLHHFSDASETGYGQCSYLRLVDAQGNVVVSLVFAKSRVCPVNYVSIPRLELVAALLSCSNVSNDWSRAVTPQHFSLLLH